MARRFRCALLGHRWVRHTVAGVVTRTCRHCHEVETVDIEYPKDQIPYQGGGLP